MDYKLISEAITYYQEQGYEYIDLPWHVSKKYLKITTTKENIIKTNNNLHLVGSAEQSFLSLNLPKGKYVGCTPCFRNDVIDEFHQPYFMKVELFQTDNTSESELSNMIFQVRNFFKFTTKLVTTTEGYDLTLNNIEIGSYGRRSYKNLQWLYGTGLAEPRYTQAKNQTLV